MQNDDLWTISDCSLIAPSLICAFRPKARYYLYNGTFFYQLLQQINYALEVNYHVAANSDIWSSSGYDIIIPNLLKWILKVKLNFEILNKYPTYDKYYCTSRPTDLCETHKISLWVKFILVFKLILTLL